METTALLATSESVSQPWAPPLRRWLQTLVETGIVAAAAQAMLTPLLDT